MSHTERDLHPRPSERSPRLTRDVEVPVRRRGVVGIVGAAATLVSAVAVTVAVQPRTEVSDEQWSYPWSADALVPVSLAYAIFHVFVFIGLLGLRRSGLAGPSRPATVGLVLALLGTMVLTMAEIASIPIRNSLMEDGEAGLVGAFFGVGTLLSMIGFLVVGITTVLAGRWLGWGRFPPLGVGISLVALMGLVVTPALAAGVALCGLALLTLFVCMVTLDQCTSPTPETS